jgi:hypothetical protein
MRHSTPMGMGVRVADWVLRKGVAEMASVITREIIEIVASMQAKALAFDSEHPDHPLGTRSAAEYAAAIRALVPEQEQLQVGAWMLAAGAQAMGVLMLSCADMRRAS